MMKFIIKLFCAGFAFLSFSSCHNVAHKKSQHLDRTSEDSEDKKKMTLNRLTNTVFQLATTYKEKAKYYWFIARKYNDFKDDINWKKYRALQSKAKEKLLFYAKKSELYYSQILSKIPFYNKICFVYIELAETMKYQGRFDNSVQIYYKLIKHMKSNNITCKSAYLAYLVIGKKQLKKGMYKNSIHFFTKARSISKGEFHVYSMYLTAIALLKLGKKKRAMLELNNAISYTKTKINEFDLQHRRILLMRAMERQLKMKVNKVDEIFTLPIY